MSALKKNNSEETVTGGRYLEMVFFFLLLVLLPAAAATEQRPHIFVITVDTLRRDHVGCYGYPKPTTPNIDALARESYLFENSFANASWTMPSYMSFFTGLYPGLHRTVNYQSALPEHISTLPQILKEQGYATGGIVSNPSLSASFGFGRGFEYYDDFSIVKGKELNLFDEDDYETSITASTTAALVTDYAIKWFERNRSGEKPLFLFLHYFDPHPVYLCHRPEIEYFETEYAGNIDGKLQNVKEGISQEDLQHIIALYDSEIRYTDRQIGRLLEFLKEAGLYDNAFIVFFADHGEEFLDHGGHFHGHTLYNELIAVPILLKLPRQREHVAIDYRMSLVDLLPTVLAYLGITLPEQRSGQSLVENQEIRTNVPERDIYFETEIKRPLKGFISGKHKIIKDVQKGSHQAYDMQQDFAEQEDLFLLSDPHFSLLSQQLDEYCRRTRSVPGAPIPELDEDTKEQLRALGYL